MKFIERNLKVAVFGLMNTDITAYGVKKFLKQGEQTVGGILKIGPGGKSRNISSMISVLLGKGKVAMIGETVRDDFNLWKVPFYDLEKYGVITDFIKISDFKETKKFPGIALIIVDKNGKNQIYVLPGINEDFNTRKVDNVEEIFKILQKNKGVIVLTLEMIYKTAEYIVEKCKKYNIRFIIDPGGIEKRKNYKKLLAGCYFLKPNEFETEILTGIKVKDFKNAKLAGEKLLKLGVKNVLITCGEKGGYFFSKGFSKHINIPEIKFKTQYRDETGCGDQVSAVITYGIVMEKDIPEIVKEAIVAGSLQFYKKGIEPITREEIEKELL